MGIIVFYINYCFAQRISKDLNLFDKDFGFFLYGLLIIFLVGFFKLVCFCVLQFWNMCLVEIWCNSWNDSLKKRETSLNLPEFWPLLQIPPLTFKISHLGVSNFYFFSLRWIKVWFFLTLPIP
jgi:hypothetical protein